MPQFTATEQRILAVLSDGMHHDRDAMLEALQDSEATYANLAALLYHLRKKLNVVGQDVTCELRHKNGYVYRHVRLLAHRE